MAEGKAEEEGKGDCIPSVVDLRAFDQDELLLMARDSLGEDLAQVIPKIDKKMFNLSNSCKKQTFQTAMYEESRKISHQSRLHTRKEEQGSQENSKRRRLGDLTEEAAMRKFLAEMEGKWVLKKREKIVAAKGFPDGWTVNVGLRIDGARCFLDYHDYVSPEGKSWPNFKTASAYLIANLDCITENQQMSEGISGTKGKPEEDETTTTQTNLAKGVEKADKTGTQEEKEAASAQPPVEKKYVCEVCQKEFMGEERFSGHVKTHKLEKTEANVSNPVALNLEELREVIKKQAIGWDDEGCHVCFKSVDPAELVFCSWCENEFHLACTGYDDMVPSDWTCPSCTVL